MHVCSTLVLYAQSGLNQLCRYNCLLSLQAVRGGAQDVKHLMAPHVKWLAPLHAATLKAEIAEQKQAAAEAAAAKGAKAAAAAAAAAAEPPNSDAVVNAVDLHDDVALSDSDALDHQYDQSTQEVAHQHDAHSAEARDDEDDEYMG